MIFYIVFRWTRCTGGRMALAASGAEWFLESTSTTRSFLRRRCNHRCPCRGPDVADSQFAIWPGAGGDPRKRATPRFAAFPCNATSCSASSSATVVGLAGTLFGLLKYFISADLVHVAFSGGISR
jgi:hypothetical protein